MTQNAKVTIPDFHTYLTDNKKVSKNTLAAYERDLTLFLDYLGGKYNSVVSADTQTISAFKEHLISVGFSNSSVCRVMSSLRTYYKYLLENGFVTSNPAKLVKNEKIEKKDLEILTNDEIDRLLAVPDADDMKGMRDKAMLEILYATGVKVSELISFDIDDVNLQLEFIRCKSSVGTKNDRVILLYPVALKALSNYINNSRKYLVADRNEKALFVNISGERMTRQGFWKLLKSYAARAKIEKEITPGMLRHSFATHLLENGANVKDIQEILGHTDSASTQIYVRYLRNKMKSSYLKFHPRA